MSQLSDRALAIAKSQVGQKENPLGSNWGHPVQDYLASVGLYQPASWCMAFVYWCVDHAANQLGMANPLTKTGGVLNSYHTFKGYKALVGHNVELPESGYIFIMDLGNGLGHTGFVEARQNGIAMATIEGNTNDTGSREGIEVAEKTRQNKAPIIGYLVI